MFLFAVGTSSFDSKPFVNLGLNTSSNRIGNFTFFLAFDNKVSTFIQRNSIVALTESIGKIGSEKINSVLTLEVEKLLENLVLDLIFADLNRKEISVIRPFFSQKALYYTISEDKKDFRLSTHIKLLKKAGTIIRENRKAVAEYFIFGHVMPPATLCDGIEKLVSGQNLKISCGDDELSLDWSIFPFGQEKLARLDEDRVSENIIEMLNSTIEKLKPFKNKIALSFSGGLDSSIIAKLLEEDIGEINAYSMNYPFENPKKSVERQYAFTGAKALKLKHTHLAIDQKQYLTNLIEIIAEGEEVLWLFLQAPLFCALFENPPKNEEMIILGDGADTLFGDNYHNTIYYLSGAIHPKTFAEYLRVAISKFSKNPHLRKLLQVFLKLFGKESGLVHFSMTQTGESLDDPNHFLWQHSIIGDEEWVAQKFQVSPEQITSDLRKRIEPYLPRSLLDLASICTFSNAVTFSMLRKVGEKYGRHLLSPYFNDLLVTYAFQLPWEFKLRQPKFALRNVARKIGIPEFVITRPKSGFGTKPEYWALPGKIFEPITTLCREVFSEEEFRAMQSEDSRKSATFWFMINYAIWKEIFINDISPDELKRRLNKSIKTSWQKFPKTKLLKEGD